MANTAKTASQSNYSSILKGAKVINGMLSVSLIITNEEDGTSFPSVRTFKPTAGANLEVIAIELEANKDDGKIVGSLLNKYSYEEGQNFCLVEQFATEAQAQRMAEKRSKK